MTTDQGGVLENVVIKLELPPSGQLLADVHANGHGTRPIVDASVRGFIHERT